MKHLEAIATSDWHFEGLKKHFPFDHVARQLKELDKVYQYAIEHGVKHVFVPGDICDTPNMSSDTYISLLLFLRKYDGLINTYYIAGNHDFSDVTRTSMDLLHVLYEQGFFKSFHVFLRPAEMEIEGVPVNFLPYPCKKAPESDIPHLNFSHVEYNGALGDNGRKLRVKESFEQNDGDFNVSGHIHLYQYLKSKRAIFVGNPYQKNFGESLPKGFVHFKAALKNDKIVFKHKFVRQKPDFRFENAVIEKREDFAKLSTSDSIRYKLWVDPSVEIPKDLRVKYPNITGGIFDLGSKKKAEESDDVVLEAEGSVKTGTSDFKRDIRPYLKNMGFDKRQIKVAQSEISKAASELGIAL